MIAPIQIITRGIKNSAIDFVARTMGVTTSAVGIDVINITRPINVTVEGPVSVMILLSPL